MSAVPLPERPSLATEPDTDADLIDQVRRGSLKGLGTLYDRVAGDLYRVALRITASSADAEDVVHDLFVGLPERLRRYDERGAVSAWLRSVVIRMALSRLRHVRRREVLLGADADGTGVPSAPSDPWSAIDLERAIAALPDDLRTVFVLRQIEDLSHDEIAAALGLTSGATRVRYLRSLTRLRQLLDPSR